ncbi:MAG: hypothetical protein J6N72_05590 [Psychrobacter sp.]|nr:hypothetical protein [Psychrobacter sp.]
MLNKLQAKQMEAVHQRLHSPHLFIEDDLDIRADISAVLFDAYIASVDKLDFINNAVKGPTHVYDDDSTEYLNVTVIADYSDFFDKNRINIIKCFEEYVTRYNTESPIISMSDCVTGQIDREKHEDVTPHEIGLIVYGNDADHAKYDCVARELSYWVAAKSAELFFEVASNLEGEPLVQIDYHIDEFLDHQDAASGGMGRAQTKAILRAIGDEEFAKIALGYPDINNNRRVKGEIPELKYISDSMILDFYKFNRSDAINWLNDYINTSNYHHKLKENDLLGSLHLWMNNIGLMPHNNGISIFELADIVYADNQQHKHYRVVIKAIGILMVEWLTTSYQKFHTKDCL